jgi:hypothetical protein
MQKSRQNQLFLLKKCIFLLFFYNFYGKIEENCVFLDRRHMVIKTSYYTNPAVSVAVARGAIPVRISIGSPRFKISYREQLAFAPELAPESGMQHIPPDEYNPLYRDILDEETVEKITERFNALSNSGKKKLILLCFCKPGLFCHRYLFRDWWAEKTGIIITEL